MREFDRAAALSIEANALQLADFRNRGWHYDPARHRLFIDKLIESFSPDFFEQVCGFGIETERPVFIVGLPRSGTTLTEQILASHPRVHGAGELTLARRMFETLPGAELYGGMPFDFLPSLDRECVQSLGRRYLDELSAIDQQADRVVDKMPDNTIYLGLIATLFPRENHSLPPRPSRRGFIVLDDRLPRSALGMRPRPDRPANPRARAVDGTLAAGCCRRRYSRLTMKTWSPTSRSGHERSSSWCGLEWDPACLEFHKTKRPVQTSSVVQVRQPIYKRSVGRWKNYEQTLSPLFTSLAGRQVN